VYWSIVLGGAWQIFLGEAHDGYPLVASLISGTVWHGKQKSWCRYHFAGKLERNDEPSLQQRINNQPPHTLAIKLIHSLFIDLVRMPYAAVMNTTLAAIAGHI
jgi:hypothetical protein